MADHDHEPARGASSGDRAARDSNHHDSSSGRSSRGLPGQELANYRVLEELGRGAQGYVFLAEDPKLRRHVALKVLPSSHLFSTSARIRFEREAEAAGRLDHPGIARVYDFGEAEGTLYIAMEYVKGKTLARLISESSSEASGDSLASEVHFDFEDDSALEVEFESEQATGTAGTSSGREAILGAVAFIESAARAIHAAHEAGLLHRDVKPGNLMIREDGSACVLDFGLARDEESEGMTLTQTGDLMGTPAYMSPEQLLAHKMKLDRRTDIYSLGVTLYEACTLTRPFRAETRRELYDAIANKEPVPPRQLNPKIPKDLEAVILTSMDKDRDRRYATALDFAEDLRRFHDFEPIHARPAGRIVKVQRWAQRNPAVAISISLVFLLLTVSMIVLYRQGEDARKARDLAEDETRRKSAALAAERRERNAKESALEERDRALTDYARLADLQHVRDAREAFEALSPPGPDLVPRVLAWREDHGDLANRLEGHRRFLDKLRAMASPYLEEARRKDHSASFREIEDAKKAIAQIDCEMPEVKNEKQREKRLETRKRASARIDELERVVRERRSWTFADREVAFQHNIMTTLVEELEDFVSSDSGPVRSYDRLLSRCRRIEQATLVESATAWQACRERIAGNPVYAGLELAPQLGLIPLGPDPGSGFEEFLHWLTHEGPIPRRDEKGRIAVTADLGIVLVLVPGGSFTMGAQAKDSLRPDFEEDAALDESPPHELDLQAFMFGKYEVTQAQWLRFESRNPSQYAIGFDTEPLTVAVDGRHPVEMITWFEARDWVRKVGLVLPTEAEWEYAATAGTRLPYAGCSKPAELARYANLSGEETRPVGFGRRINGNTDPWICHGPAGCGLPNAWGIYNLSGNVGEWCADAFSDYRLEPGPRGLRSEPEDSEHRMSRGGTFTGDADIARIRSRTGLKPFGHFHNLGFRAGRLITRAEAR